MKGPSCKVFFPLFVNTACDDTKDLQSNTWMAVKGPAFPVVIHISSLSSQSFKPRSPFDEKGWSCNWFGKTLNMTSCVMGSKISQNVNCSEYVWAVWRYSGIPRYWKMVTINAPKSHVCPWFTSQLSLALEAIWLKLVITQHASDHTTPTPWPFPPCPCNAVYPSII